MARLESGLKETTEIASGNNNNNNDFRQTEDMNTLNKRFKDDKLVADVV